MLLIPELECAIAGLYTAFKSRTLPTVMLGCPCCAGEAELRRLSFTPIGELGCAELEPYAWNAIWTVGTEQDYRHFTPRLLELMVSKGAFQAESVTKKLRLAGWTSWSEQEQSALRSFFRALWNSALIAPTAWSGAEDSLCVIGNAVDDLMPFLERWQNATEPTAVQQLVEFAAGQIGNASNGFVGNPFWDERQPQMLQVTRWLTDRATLQHLEQRWVADSDGPLAKSLEEAVYCLSLAHQDKG